jgi:hypothetical protein
VERIYLYVPPEEYAEAKALPSISRRAPSCRRVNWERTRRYGQKKARLSSRSPTRFSKHSGSFPSDFVSEADAGQYSRMALGTTRAAGIKHFGIRVHGAGEYPVADQSLHRLSSITAHSRTGF